MSISIKPKLHPNFNYQHYVVGKEKIPLLVIDNFLENPETLIQYCLDTNSFNNADSFYPGVRMLAPELYIYAMRYYLADLIEAIFGLKKSDWRDGRAAYSMIVTRPENISGRQSIPHVDSFKPNDLACVHYLCDSTKGGTSLYRHKKTGFEIINDARIAHYNKLAIDEGILDITPKSYMNGSTLFFEQIACIDAMFNRMIIYPTHVLHSANIAPGFDFDPNPETGRLTLNSFIYSKESAD